MNVEIEDENIYLELTKTELIVVLWYLSFFGAETIIVDKEMLENKEKIFPSTWLETLYGYNAEEGYFTPADFVVRCKSALDKQKAGG